MKYAGMPMGMWVLFAGSFQKQLTAVLGYDAATARTITKKAKPQYRQIIAGLPEFEKADRFKMNIVNCAMLGAFVLSMPHQTRKIRTVSRKRRVRIFCFRRRAPPHNKSIRSAWPGCFSSGAVRCGCLFFRPRPLSQRERSHCA